MKLHEYQAKELFRAAGMPAPEGKMVTTVDDAIAAAEAYGLPVVLKAQVHVGGRGKAGGVKVVTKLEDVGPTAKAILALTIKELPVRKLLVTPALDIATEVYLSILIDRGTRSVVFIGCADGGVEIEETAKTNPEKILRHEVSAGTLGNVSADSVMPLASQLFEDASQAKQAAAIMVQMAKLFQDSDAALIEINPLIADESGTVICLDAKMLLDDNALYRHEDLETLRDMDSEDQDELDAKQAGLSFIRLDGTIGCMVNGAGLAMATMDTIKHFGGDPANFLDVGGSSDPKKVVVAFKMILKDPKIKVILVNIFGGITRCDDIAKGIVTAMDEIDVSVPIIVRLVGTNEKEGRAILEGTKLESAETLEAGATKAAKIGNVA